MLVAGLDTLIKMKKTVRDRDRRDLNFLKKKAEEREKLLNKALFIIALNAKGNYSPCNISHKIKIKFF